MNNVSRTFQSMWCVTFVAVTVAAAGCSSDTNPKTYEVSGVLTHNGKPVDEATLVFIPEGSDGYPATAITNADGSYQLTTFNANDGAVPGDYSIKVSKLEYKEGPAAGEQVYTSSEEENESYELAESAAAPPKNLLPAKYANPMTSELNYTVTETPATFDIDLK